MKQVSFSIKQCMPTAGSAILFLVLVQAFQNCSPTEFSTVSDQVTLSSVSVAQSAGLTSGNKNKDNSVVGSGSKANAESVSSANSGSGSKSGSSSGSGSGSVAGSGSSGSSGSGSSAGGGSSSGSSAGSGSSSGSGTTTAAQNCVNASTDKLNETYANFNNGYLTQYFGGLREPGLLASGGGRLGEPGRDVLSESEFKCKYDIPAQITLADGASQTFASKNPKLQGSIKITCERGHLTNSITGNTIDAQCVEKSLDCDPVKLAYAIDSQNLPARGLIGKEGQYIVDLHSVEVNSSLCHYQVPSGKYLSVVTVKNYVCSIAWNRNPGNEILDAGTYSASFQCLNGTWHATSLPDSFLQK